MTLTPSSYPVLQPSLEAYIVSEVALISRDKLVKHVKKSPNRVLIKQQIILEPYAQDSVSVPNSASGYQTVTL